MQINELPAGASVSNDDVIAIEINGVTYKLTGATLAAALKTLGNFVKSTGDTMTDMLAIKAGGGVQIMLSQGDSHSAGAKVYVLTLTDSEKAQLRFRSYAPPGTHFEDFVFPATLSDLSVDRGYEIYTSKNPPVIYRDYSFSETLAANAVLHKRVDSSGIAVSGYTPIGATVIQSTTNILASTVTANIYNGTQAFLHIINGGVQQTITGTVRVAYAKNT